MLLKENNPWKGLASYSFSDSKLFYGREAELDTLLLSIKENYCTILYGVSGAGKTSLIHAGLCPQLKEGAFLPIVVRLDHSEGSPSYSGQILRKCQEELTLNECECESPVDWEAMDISDTSKLWLFFHASTFWTARNEKTIPCVFIDQFEEIFSLNEENTGRITSFFDDFNQVYQSIPSDELLSILNESETPFSVNDRPSFRLALSMREDFLSRLEDYCLDIPFLRQNRRRLNLLTGEQALSVILKPYPGIVDEGTARHILAKVTGKDLSKKGVELDRIEVDTSILSLFCSELYNKAAQMEKDTITEDLVSSLGDDILNDFYESNISRLSSRAIRYLESQLLTKNGFRSQPAVEDIDERYVSSKDIRELEECRLIRRETINGTDRIEFSHDVLAKIANAHRSERGERKKNYYDLVAEFLSGMTLVLWAVLLYSFRDSFFISSVDWNGDEVIFPFGNHAFLYNPIIFAYLILWMVGTIAFLRQVSIKTKNVLFLTLSFIAFVWPSLVPLRWAFRHSFISVLHFLFSFIVFIFVLIKPSRKVGFWEEAKRVFSIKDIRETPLGALTVTAICFVMSLFLVYRAAVIKSTSLTLVTLLSFIVLYRLLFPLFGQPSIKNEGLINESFDKKREKHLLIRQGLILLVPLVCGFVLSIFLRFRFLSYLLLLLLFADGLFITSKWFKKNGWRQYVLNAYFWLLCPLASLGFPLFSLGNNAIVPGQRVEKLAYKYNKKLWVPLNRSERYLVIKDKEGREGLISERGVLIKPQFYDIKEEFQLSDAENRPFRSWGSEQFMVKTSPSGDYMPWNVMYHLDADNRFTRDYMRHYARSPFGVISTRNILNSLKDSSSEQFDEFAQRLFFNELNFSVLRQTDLSDTYLGYDSHLEVLPLYDKLMPQDTLAAQPSRSIIRRLFGKNPDAIEHYSVSELCERLLQNIQSNDANTISYALFTEALDAVFNSRAMESKELRKTLQTLLKAYIANGGFEWRMHDDLATVLLFDGNYEEARKEAYTAVNLTSETKPHVRFIEALMLLEDDSYPVFLARKIGHGIEIKDAALSRTVRVYYGFDHRMRYFEDQQENQIAVGDLIVADTARFDFPPSVKSYLQQLDGYGTMFRYSQSFVTGDHYSPTFLFSNSSRQNGRNWYDVNVRVGSQQMAHFDRLTLGGKYPAVYFEGDKRGYVALDGESMTIYPPLYDHAWIYSEGIAVASIGDELLFIDEKGKVIARPHVPVFTDMDLVFKDGALLYHTDGYQYGLLGRDGNWILPPEYDYVGPPENGLRVIRNGDRYGLVRSNGRVILKPEYDYVSWEDDVIIVTRPDGESLGFPIQMADTIPSMLGTL